MEEQGIERASVTVGPKVAWPVAWRDLREWLALIDHARSIHSVTPESAPLELPPGTSTTAGVGPTHCSPDNTVDNNATTVAIHVRNTSGSTSGEVNAICVGPH